MLALCHSGVGGTPAPKHDLHRFVKWPKYVRIQRQRASLESAAQGQSPSPGILTASARAFMNDHAHDSPEVGLFVAFLETECRAAMQVPPALHRFTKAADKNLAETVFKLLLKYRPEDKAAKKQRLLSEVRAQLLCSTGAHAQ